MKELINKIFLSIIITIFQIRFIKTQIKDIPTATTKYGKISGRITFSGVKAFLGIPYAQAPIGNLRFKPPMDINSWEPETKMANSYGPRCIQETSNSTKFSDLSEDCLFLNIWVPSKGKIGSFNVTNIEEKNQLLPVMVYVHGGSFTRGSGNELLLNGNKFVQNNNVIIVTLNYRLGLLGFLTADIMNEYDEIYKKSGNLGLYDQRKAFQWIKENIAAFGGNPDNMTAFGESAGSFSVCYHLLMKESANLFNKVILQSGSCALPSFPTTKSSPNGYLIYLNGNYEFRKKSGNLYVKNMGCNDMKCLLDKPASEFIEFSNKNLVTTWATYDNIAFEDEPLTLLQEGKINKVDVLIGVNLDEGTLFSRENIPILLYESYVKSLFPKNSDEIFKKYPIEKYGSAGKAASHIAGDSMFICPTRQLNFYFSNNNFNIYKYYFTQIPEFLTLEQKMQYGSFHSAELLYVFGNYQYNMLNRKNKDATDEEVDLSNTIQDLWSSFATNGKPDSDKINSNWVPYELKGKNYMILNTDNISLGKNLREDECNLYDSIIPLQRKSFYNDDNSKKGYTNMILERIFFICLILFFEFGF